MNTLISMDGVLRGPTGDLIIDGLMIYRAFKELGRVTLTTASERKVAETWLMLHGMPDFDDLLDSSYVLDPAENLKHRHMSVARSLGPVGMYIDSDAGAVAEALKRGFTSLLFSAPEYVRPEFRPDAPKGVRPWDELIAERTRQQAMKAVDRRAQQVPDDAMAFE